MVSRAAMAAMTLLTAVVVFAGLYGCVAAPTPIPNGASRGAGVYRARCGSCHSLAHPKRFTKAQWESWLAWMERIMLERGAPPMTAQERRTIEGYLKDNARQ